MSNVMNGYVALRNGNKILMIRIAEDDDMCPVISIPFNIHPDHVASAERLCGFDVFFDVEKIGEKEFATNIRKFTLEELEVLRNRNNKAV